MEQSQKSLESCEGKPAAMRMTSLTSDHTRTSSGSRMNQIHFITEAQSVVPCLASTFSLVENVQWDAGLRDGQPAMSVQERLQTGLDSFDDPDYLDTVRSCDSSGSLLRRSMSVPAPSQHPRISEIFSDYPLDWHSREPKSSKTPWRQTMDDILEKPNYIDELNKQGIVPDSVTPPNYVRNLLILSISFMLVFAAYLAIRNLQSSLNGGIGLAALGCVYAFMCLGCMLSPTLVQRLRPKRTMVAAMCGLLTYVIVNLHPAAWTLLPAAAIAGVSLASLWTAHATYMTSAALSHASATDQSPQRVLTRFNGVFFSFFQTAQLLGGVLSSVVLSPRDTPKNTTVHIINIMDNVTYVLEAVTSVPCGAGFTGAAGAKAIKLSTTVTLTMIGIFALLLLMGLVLLMIQLHPLDGAITRSHASIGKQLFATFRFFVDVRVVCLLPLMFYSFLQMSFMVGEYTKAFVTCAVGVEMVGYAMVSQSVCSAVSSFLNDKMQKYVGRIALFIAAAVINLGLLLVMFFWNPSPNTLAVLFLVAGGWGVADGLFMTQLVSLFGMLFADNREPAFAGLKMCQALAAMFFYLVSPYVATAFKMCLLAVVLVVAMMGYVALEARLRRCKGQQPVNGMQPVDI